MPFTEPSCFAMVIHKRGFAVSGVSEGLLFVRVAFITV